MTTIRMNIADLRAHPEQQQIYGDLNPIEFQSLKEDLEELGQRQPIEVTAAGMIIDGHQRVRALKELGHTEIDVIVREDLSQDQLDELFLYANLTRRQLDPVARARIYTEIAQRDAWKRGDTSDFTHEMEFREWLAERIGGGLSGRTVGRYLQLLRLPREVQDAVSNGQLPMTLALKVESLEDHEQQAVAERIAAGDFPRSVVMEAMDRAAPPQEDDDLEDDNLEGVEGFAADDDSPQAWYHYFVKHFEMKVPEFDADPQSLVGTAGDYQQSAEILSSAAEFFARMSQLEFEAADMANSEAVV
jgi:ParB/RepB/Spo0J family partition protein